MTDDFDWNRNAIQLANEISKTVPDDSQAGVTRAATLVVDGLRNICDTDESAVKVAMTVTRILAVLLSAHMSEVGDMGDNMMVVYAMAAGNLAGGFDLPEAPEPTLDFIPDFLPPEWGVGL